MSSDWPEVRVEEIAASDSNALSTGPFGSAISSKFFASSGVPVIRGSNLSADVGVKLIDENLAFVSFDKAKEFRRSVAKRGDLVFTCWGTINQVGLIHDRSKYPEYVVSNKQMKLTVDAKKVDSKFLYYVFSSPEKQHEILSNGIGAAVPGFNLGQLKRHTFRLPPLDVQQSVVKVLDSLDAKIDVNRSINQTLEALAQAIFKSWFVDFDPVKAKIAAKAEGRDPLRAAMSAISGKPDAELDTLPPDQFAPLAATAALFPEEMEDSELGEIPKGWAYRPLSQMVNLIGGGTPKRSEAGYWNGEIPWFSVKDAPAEGDVFVIDTEENITAEGLSKSATRLLPVGVTIISARGTVGKLALVGTPMAMNQSCYGVQGAQGIGPYFNFFNLKTAIDSLKQNTHGAVFDTITQSTFDTVNSVCPQQHERDAFEAVTKPLLQKIQVNLKETRCLAALRDALLPKLLSGELVVPATVSLAVAEGE